MPAFFVVAYFAIGLAQLFAIQDWFIGALGWGSVLSFIAGIFVTYIPLVGSALGVIGAHDYWGWTWTGALFLFFWYFPVGIVFALLSSVFERK